MSLLKENSFLGNEEIEFKMNAFRNNSFVRRQTYSDRFSSFQESDAHNTIQSIDRRFSTQINNTKSKEATSQLELQK